MRLCRCCLPALDAGAGGLGRWRLAGGRGGLAEVEERSGWGLGGARRRDREGGAIAISAVLGLFVELGP